MKEPTRIIELSNTKILTQNGLNVICPLKMGNSKLWELETTQGCQ
jgi:hypothetical protein